MFLFSSLLFSSHFPSLTFHVYILHSLSPSFTPPLSPFPILAPSPLLPPTSNLLPPPPPSPKPPIPAFLSDSDSISIFTPLFPQPPKIYRHARQHKNQHDQRLPRLRHHRPAHQEQTHTAEDDGRRDPRAVGPLEIRLADPQNDQAEDGQEVEAVAGDAVEGDEGLELADQDVQRREEEVEAHGVDGGEQKGKVSAQQAGEEAGEFGGGGGVAEAGEVAVHAGVLVRRRGEADAAKDGGEVVFLAGDVDETAGCESGGVDGAKTGGGDGECEYEGADGAKHSRPELHGDGVGLLDRGEGEHKEVGDVSEQVR